MKAQIAILRWEQGKVPKGLKQLEKLKGNSTNAASYPFPVIFEEIEGAGTETVIRNPDPEIAEKMIQTAGRLVREQGVRAVSTSCGFNSIFQKEVSEKIDVPFFSSSLLQIPFIQRSIGREKTVLIVTADSRCLKETHLEACGIRAKSRLKIIGLESEQEWNALFQFPDQEIDCTVIEKDLLRLVTSAIKEDPSIGAINLECTDLPPFSESLRKETDLPVFDFMTMIGQIAFSLGLMNLH